MKRWKAGRPRRRLYACFVVILQLVASGKPELAQQLWQSFDRRATAEGWGAREFPPDLAARWQIVREVIELLGRVPKRMTRALAHATLNGEYYQAAEAVEEALLLEGEGMQHVFSKRAPTLYAAVWPAVDAARRPAPTQASSGSFRSGAPWWVMPLLAWMALRFCTQLGKDSPRVERPAITMPAPRAERSPEPPAPFAEPAVDFGEVRQRQLRAVGAAVDDALAHNDCGMLGEQWPLYTAALRGSAEPERSAFERRRAEARLRCQELAQQLEVEP